MRRHLLIGAVGLLFFGALPANAATRQCGGIAPVQTSCSFSVTATSNNVYGGFDFHLVPNPGSPAVPFTGSATFTLSGSRGSTQASCTAFLTGGTCGAQKGDLFKTGDTVSVSVSTAGAGSWTFNLNY